MQTEEGGHRSKRVSATPTHTAHRAIAGHVEWLASQSLEHGYSAQCVIRRKTDTGSEAKRTTFRRCPDKVPAESGQLT